MPGGSILMPSARKSDIPVAAAGPAMKLAQSMTLSPSKIRSVTSHSPWIIHHRDTEHAEGLCALCLCGESLNGEAVRIAVAHDMSGRRAGEMGADHQHRPFRKLGQHAFPRLARLLRVAVGRRR